ncbi:MAG: ATP-binding protein [Candidatus Woesearchaeota archaeon]|nr:ATP-binding protein [Candidatus Woesearchaeota archaeon]
MLREHFKKAFLGKDNLTDILGQDKAKEDIKSALLMGRHMIIVGPPGVGKTTLAKNIAKLLPEITVNNCPYNCLPEEPICPECLNAKGKVKSKKIPGEKRFVRIQGSPDLTPEDLLGDIDPIKAMKFGPLSVEAFSPGKIFKANNGILFFDEVNRCPEKLQNALLQVLEEGKITIGSYEIDFPVNFIFIGTMNPDDRSTEPLSDVFLDRFDFAYMSYPEELETEMRIVSEKGEKIIDFPEKLLRFVISFIRNMRTNKDLEKLPSVRASIGVYERAQSNAYLKGRKSVEPDDIEEVMVSVLSHRITLKPAIRFVTTTEELIKKEIRQAMDELAEKGGYL